MPAVIFLAAVWAVYVLTGRRARAAAIFALVVVCLYLVTRL